MSKQPVDPTAAAELAKLDAELKAANADVTVTVEHDFAKDDSATVTVDPVKRTEALGLKFKI